MPGDKFIQLAVEFHTLTRRFQATTDEVMRAALDRHRFARLATDFSALSNQFRATTDEVMRAVLLAEIREVLKR